MVYFGQGYSESKKPPPRKSLQEHQDSRSSSASEKETHQKKKKYMLRDIMVNDVAKVFAEVAPSRFKPEIQKRS
jgi:hypothetical protein